MENKIPVPDVEQSAQRLTLSAALNRIHVIVIFTAIGLAGFLLTLLALIALRSHAESNLQLTARAIGYTTEAALVFNDPAAARDSLEFIARRGDFAQAKILTPAGVIFTEWLRPVNSNWDKLGKIIGHVAFPEPVTIPVVHSGSVIGTVWLAGNGSSLIGFLLETVLSLLGCLVLTALVALYFSRRMQKGIVDALGHITHVTHEVSANRSFNLRVPSAPIAELHTLSQDFNSLLTELEAWENHIRNENVSLTKKALHDGLTGLHNRAFFIDTLNQCFNPMRPALSLALLFIDVDNFKEINDSLGHAAGDRVLMVIGERLAKTLRKGDVLARLGGDEFAILLEPMISTAEAVAFAERIVDIMKTPVILLNNKTLDVSLSIGIALSPSQANSTKEILEKADEAMYRSKKISGSCWHVSTGMPLSAAMKD
ncbi:diguanylate cyclase domain-containing protein [Rahnella woolbedingensis]|uniref:diguanylate cyclase n=1 Tax=Rahnella woolbedingensis TaxID=1510574 RepID=A0A419NAH4_9GAMM|nr:diguanylate cyclase [Rahnella woolbedingensis]RJT44891.1 diguanylate cyclase [Rahnella woolbedingensis]